jgi:hypothetical protein
MYNKRERVRWEMKGERSNNNKNNTTINHCFNGLGNCEFEKERWID